MSEMARITSSTTPMTKMMQLSPIPLVWAPMPSSPLGVSDRSLQHDYDVEQENNDANFQGACKIDSSASSSIPEASNTPRQIGIQIKVK